jgi:UDP-N-acetylmuramoylalanine--D-glutamate ligase
VIRRGGSSETLPLPATRWLSGPYQRLNAAAAAAAAYLAGAPVGAILVGLAAFAGVENRAELVTTIGGVEYVNDTAATAPAAAIASIQGYAGRRVHLIAGGADKRLPLDELGRIVATTAATVTLLDGTATPALRASIERYGGRVQATVDTMAGAVDVAAGAATDGDVVLLAPGCASFGLFRDEFDRGRQFREAVAPVGREGPMGSPDVAAGSPGEPAATCTASGSAGVAHDGADSAAGALHRRVGDR